MEACNHRNTFTVGLNLLKNLLTKTNYSEEFKWSSIYPGLYKLCKSTILRGFPRTKELETEQNTGINSLWLLMKQHIAAELLPGLQAPDSIPLGIGETGCANRQLYMMIKYLYDGYYG